MRHLLRVILLTVIFAAPSVAQEQEPDRGPDLTKQDSSGTEQVRDTTEHTKLDNGATVSTSTGKDGKPNGGGGQSSGGGNKGSGGENPENK